MSVDLAHIQLELAPCAEHRFGDRRFGYYLDLPLDGANRIDLDRLRGGEQGAVTALRPTEQVSGAALLRPDGGLAFRFAPHEVGDASLSGEFRGFALGQIVEIEESDSRRRPYQVIAIRRHDNVLAGPHSLLEV